MDGIIWPCGKDEALEALAANGAPDDVLETLRGSEDRRFVSPSDLRSALWEEAQPQRDSVDRGPQTPGRPRALRARAGVRAPSIRLV